MSQIAIFAVCLIATLLILMLFRWISNRLKRTRGKKL
jgi:hypothetical protein